MCERVRECWVVFCSSCSSNNKQGSWNTMMIQPSCLPQPLPALPPSITTPAPCPPPAERHIPYEMCLHGVCVRVRVLFFLRAVEGEGVCLGSFALADHQRRQQATPAAQKKRKMALAFASQALTRLPKMTSKINVVQIMLLYLAFSLAFDCESGWTCSYQSLGRCYQQIDTWAKRGWAGQKQSLELHTFSFGTFFDQKFHRKKKGGHAAAESSLDAPRVKKEELGPAGGEGGRCGGDDAAALGRGRRGHFVLLERE